ncbi:MAG: polyprenyl synthetase family protein [Candidatus Omnitrophica bacterium]|nr:polyprenyl synthetase family protein [Candidatus Omnitrophota bacterium]
MKYETYFRDSITAVDEILQEVLPPEGQRPSILHEAMRYAVFTGGKRFRPVLVLAAAEACGGTVQDALYPAAAIELVHAYSLVHDDLPALDNDETRRGKPTCHKQFGEAIAILAGDGLLTLAFQTLTKVRSARKVQQLLMELSTAAGSCGMIGGQVADLTLAQADLDLPMLDYISVHKTGKLIKASTVFGAISADAGEETKQKLLKFGELLGMAFQSVDDMIDGDGYLKLMKSREVSQKVRDLIAKAKREIKSLGDKAGKLQTIADFLIRRIPRGSHVKVDRQN